MTVGRRLDVATETHPECGPDRHAVLGEDLGARLHLRAEVQHLVRLPKSDAVLLLIRTYLLPLEDLARVPEWRDRLAAVLEEHPASLPGRHVGSERGDRWPSELRNRALPRWTPARNTRPVYSQATEVQHMNHPGSCCGKPYSRLLPPLTGARTWSSALRGLRMPGREPVLTCAQVTVTLDGTPILHAVDLELLPGEVHVLIGPNGAGKTTLANAITGHRARHCAERHALQRTGARARGDEAPPPRRPVLRDVMRQHGSCTRVTSA